MADSEVRQKFEAAKVAHDEFWRGLGIERLLIPDDFRTGFKEGFFAGMRAGEIARWIPVEEKLPQHRARVLVYKEIISPEIQSATYWVGHSKGSGFYCGNAVENVTHWQPLPAAPEEKKSATPAELP